MSLPKPNYTQIPNLFFDAMPDMKEGELRILLAVARQTFGYHRESDYLSITQFCKMTGLSRQGVANGIKAAVKRGWLSEIGTGKRGMRLWKLALVNEVDESTETTSQLSSIVPVNEVVQTPPSTIQPSRNTKERIPKETQGKKSPTPLPPHLIAMQNGLNASLLPYLEQWQQAAAINGIEPPIPSGQRGKMLEDAQTLADMECTPELWGEYIAERKAKKKSTVWTFAFGDVHEFMARKKSTQSSSNISSIRSDIHYVPETDQTMIFDWEKGRWDTFPGKLESRPA